MASLPLSTLDDAERFARELLWHTSQAAAFVFDSELTLTYAGGDSLRSAGFDARELIGRPLHQVLPPAAWDLVRPYYERVLAGERFVSRHESVAGRSYRFHGTPVVSDTGTLLGGILVSFETVTHAEERLSQRLRQQAAVAELGRLAISGADFGELTEVASRLIIETLASVDGVGLLELLPGAQEVMVRHESSGRLTGQRVPVANSLHGAVLKARAPVVVSDVLTDGIPFSAQLRSLGARSAACVPVGRPEAPFGILGAFCTTPFQFGPDDVAFLESLANVLAEAVRREEADAALRHQALHDVVTELPNRALLEDRLRQALAAAEREDLRVGVLFVDLDRFKVINDSLGHHAGDAVLRTVGARLQRTVRASDTVGRFGGDEFVIVGAALASQEDAVRIAESVLAELAEPLVISGQQVHVRASVGIRLADPGERNDPAALIRDADAAMYRAKVRGRGRYELVEPHAGRAPIDRLHVEQELRRALRDGDLRLEYQPFVRLHDGEILGAEALLRWLHPTRGYLGPADFLDVAEQSGLMVPIGEWMLREACGRAVEWATGRDFLLTLNLSAGQLADAGIVVAVGAALAGSGLPPHNLGLELTEHVLVGDERDALGTLTALKGLGVKLLLDDFGTGFSSLSHLKRFPIDVVKIDRSFTEGLDSGDGDGDGDDAAIVSAIVGMSRATGKRVIPEGIETAAQLAALTALGCDRGQGYLFARPMPPEDFDGWIARPPAGSPRP